MHHHLHPNSSHSGRRTEHTPWQKVSSVDTRHPVLEWRAMDAITSSSVKSRVFSRGVSIISHALGPPVVVSGIYDFSVLPAIPRQRGRLKCMNRFIVPCKFLPLVIYDRCLATICCAGISVDTWDHFAIYFWYVTTRYYVGRSLGYFAENERYSGGFNYFDDFDSLIFCYKACANRPI